MALNPFTALSSWWSPAALEADVLTLISKAKSDFAVATADIKAAVGWINANAGTIATSINSVIAVVAELGLATNPQIAAAIAAANVAVDALNAYAKAVNSGKPTADAVLLGYTAVKTAQKAQAMAGLAVASAKAA